MLSNRYSKLRKFLGPLSRRISRIVGTAQNISHSPRHGLRLLFNSWSTQIQSQPDVYAFAAYLAERFGCSHVITIDRPSAKDLIHLHRKVEVIGIVPGADLHFYAHQYGFATWLDESVNLADTLVLPEAVRKRAVVICKNLDQFGNHESQLSKLKILLDQAPVCILTCSDRDLNRAGGSARTGRWNLIELEQTLRSKGFRLEFIGWTASDSVNYEKKTILAVITNDASANQIRETTSVDFRVVAFMAAYNEEDIIVQSIKKWTDQGISVHILENWSTDATYDLAKDLESRLPVTVERFPKDGPSKYFDWGAMLKRMETLSREIEADWFIRRGADEVLVSPWRG